MSLKMVVTDLDGTLLTSSDIVSQASVDAFNALSKKGILPVVATGRMYKEARFAADAIGATRFFIGMNGAQTQCLQTGESLFSQALDNDIAATIIDILDELALFYQVYTRDCVHTRPYWLENIHNSGMKAAYIQQFAAGLQPLGDVRALQVVKMFILCPTPEQQQQLRERLTPLPGITLVASHHSYFEVLPEGLNKGVALRHLCQHLGISPAHVCAIGDSDNDIELLSTAGVGIAMGNAFPRLKQHADHIVPSNDDDGIAFALKEIIPRYL